MKKILSFSLLFIALATFAQPKAGYYDAALGKSEAALKTQLYNIIKDHSVKSYDFLNTIYKTSDNTSNGQVWDMYSNCSWNHDVKKCGEYKTVCDCFNKEHSIPQSWFGKKSPMVSDAHHIYPTDGKVNGQRSDHPFGECASGKNLGGAALGKLGASTFAGYSGTVFEPIDEYKGDFARTYFYFATRYENIMTTIGGGSFNKTKYPALSSWSVGLFLKWHRQDPVSQKELDRNNAVEVYQKNRNPFIDYPELAEYIWGSMKGQVWSLAANVDQATVNFNISPNPVQSELTVKCDESDLIYSIYNLNGQILAQNELDINRKISVDQLQNGMYLIQLQSGNRKSIQKFVVVK